jgi:lipopolysaccharide biosynthesis glycosyltransferase
MQKYNIVFAADSEYLQHLSVAILSLIENNLENSLNIYIINKSISSVDWANIISLDKAKKHSFVNAKIDDAELVGFPTNSRFTIASYYRLLIAEIVPFDKALYIDSDIVVCGNLSELYKTNIADFFLAAVEDACFFNRHNELEMSKCSRYFNSGVMLLNLDKWRKNKLKEQAIDFIFRKFNKIKFADQCALNAVVDGNWLRLSPTFNLQTALLEMDVQFRKTRYGSIDVGDAVKLPIIIHYSGPNKPWQFLNSHPFKALYWNYLGRTKYKKTIPIGTDFTMKRIMNKYFPNQIKDSLRKFKSILKKIVYYLKMTKFRGLTNKEIFSKIYIDRYWGYLEDTGRRYYSGGGSHNPLIVNTYVAAVARFLRGLGHKPSIIDFGCGDFNVGSKLRAFCDGYIACDIVDDLINDNKRLFYSLDVDFRVIDMTDENSVRSLPDVEVIFVRQVFQHLSNDQILRALKLMKTKFTYLVLTEELPSSKKIIANLDIPNGYNTRCILGSGVFLTEPPFELKPFSEQIICAVPIGSSVFTTTVYKLK